MMEFRRSQTEVSRILDAPQCVISRFWQKFQSLGDVTQLPVQSRLRTTTVWQDRYLSITAQRQGLGCARELVSGLTTTTGARVSKQTVFIRESTMLICMPDDQQVAFPLRLCINMLF